MWRQIQNRLYSGSLLKNNGMLDDAVAVFEEGLRLKPDDSALHRNLIEAFESAGKIPEALNAARRLLDLEPGNAMNIERLANAYLRTGDRAGAALVAARLFSSGVAQDPSSVRGGQSYGNYAWARYAAAYSGSVYGAAYGYSGGRTNIERGTEFFMRNGLMTELEQVLREQIAAQPDNAVLKDLTANLMIGELGKPDEALALLRELETAVFPIEAPKWLGQCGQRDWMRVRQYNLIAAKPALRDQTLGALSAKSGADLSRDELLQLGAIHRSMGNNDKAAEALTRAVESGSDDILALSMLSDLLVASEKFTLAEPHARRLIGLLGESRHRMHDETVDRVRREFVRTLPIELQLRVTDAFISDIAEKWTLGSSWSYYTESQARVAGYLQAQLALATILAETGRIDDAAVLWTSIGPGDRPDADRWIELGDSAQQHKRSDLAFAFYQRAMGAAKRVLGDPLLQQVYLSSATQRSWYGEGNTIDGVFNGIVDTFAKHDALIDLYDFLRDTDQLQRARRLAEQYNLDEKLLPILRQRVERAAAAFQDAGRDDPYGASVAYFAEVCKYAEVLDRTGDWPGAQGVYEEYLRAFPDELELLRVLSEVAEKRQKLPEAIAWQKKVLECQLRLGQNSRRWMTRRLALTPSDPGVIAARGNADRYSYGSRWARNWWGYGSRDFANRSESWMRLAQLQLGSGNTIAAADAMQKCAAEAGPRRAETFQRIMDVIQKRPLVGPMLPVLRSLAVLDSGNERVQLAFAQSLEAQGRRDLALEVCERLLRRGVSDLGTLSEVRRQIEVLKPSDVSGETTVASLEAEAAADPDNMKLQVRLAKAYYYSLRIDLARPLLEEIAVKAPYLDEARELLTEVYTVLGESEKLIESLKARIARAKDDNARRELRRRLMEEYLAAGRDDEAVATAKEMGDPRNPASYLEIGALLHYFGRHEEATECYRQSTKNTRANPWGEGRDRSILARSLVLRGDVNGAADELLQGISASANQQTQYSGNAMYGTGNPFAPMAQLLALYPGFAEAVYSRVEAKYKAAPSDPAAAKLMMHLHGVLGRADKAEAILDTLAKNSTADQAVANRLIQSARARKDYARAIELATRSIEQSPKPQLAAGVPAQYAAYSMLQSPRVQMLLTLGDLLWESGEKDRAFESYKQIIDDKVDETRQVYAAICLGRGRLDEARGLIEGVLAAQTVKSAQLLATGALVACAEGDTAKAFEYLKSAASSSEQSVNQFGEQTASPLVQLRLLAQTTGREKEFVTYVEDRIKKTPEVWDSYAALVELHMSLGRPSEALAVLDRAAVIGSLERDALLMRHALTRQSGDADRSISILERLIALSDSDATGDEGLYESAAFRAELGALLWGRGEKDRALQSWTERIRSDDARDQLSLASLLDRYGEQDRAHAAVTRAVALEPDGTNGRILAARIAWERSDLPSLLEHVHACFVRGATGTNDGGYGDRNDWPGAPRFAVWAAALAASPEVSALIGGSG